MAEAKKINDAEIRIIGMEALNRALGPVSTSRFLALISREPTDYVKISRQLYRGQTIDDIVSRAKRHWKG